MTEGEREQAIREHVEWCQEQRAKAEEVLADIAEGWTFHEAHGREEMRDVTAEYAVKQREIISRMDRLISAYARRDA